MVCYSGAVREVDAALCAVLGKEILKTNTKDTATIHKHTMPKRHADSTQDENPPKRRQLSADEVLVEAAKNGDMISVRAVLEKLHPDSTVVFNTAHETCRGNHDECLALLLPYVETTQVGFGILLSECVHADHVACTDVLLQHWKSVCSNVTFVPHACDQRVDERCIFCPAMWSDPAVSRVLIDSGADIHTKNEYGRSPLLHACSSGALDVVKMLVEAGARVRDTDVIGQTCLMFAADCGHTETVRYLVGLPEVDVNQQGDEDWTALHHARRDADVKVDIVQVLIDAGADIEMKGYDGFLPLHYACLSGTLDVVKIFARLGAVCAADYTGQACLSLAADYGHTETVRYLLCLPEVEVNYREVDGKTALHCAVRKNHSDVVQVLINAGADIDTKDNRENSPLHDACNNGLSDIVKMLVEAGAGVRATDNDGHTCLILSAYFGHTETVRYLVGLPEVELNHRADDNKTALQCAVDQNHKDIAQLLIAAGADMDTENTDGRSP